MEPIIGIYKITNKINGKSYVGQSVNIHQRWTTEKNASQNPNRHEYNYPLSKAFRKYGIDNFSFTVIERCSQDELNVKETYWISFYDTFFHGYNQTLGGDSHCGTETKPKETVIGVINDLKTTDDSHTEIAKRWGVSKSMVQRINSGRTWRHDTEYPLQKRCLDIVSGVKPSVDVLSTALKDNNGNLVAVGKHFGVSDNAVRKWIKSYGLTVVKTTSATETAEKDIIKTYETCKSISQTAITHNVSIHYIKQILEKHRIKAKGRTVPKCVAMYENNQKLMCFTSANQAADHLKILGVKNPSSSHIISVCKGKRKNAYGYQWKYIDENEE